MQVLCKLLQIYWPGPSSEVLSTDRPSFDQPHGATITRVLASPQVIWGTGYGRRLEFSCYGFYG